MKLYKTIGSNILIGLLSLTALAFPAVGLAQEHSAQVKVNFSEKLGPLDISKMALGQGGLSDEPMWNQDIPEIRALKPALIRLFIQTYFNLLPEPGHYHFESLDRSVNTILAAGSEPLMCICFKPRLLFPKIDQDIVEPNNYAAWDKLIFKLVQHYKKRGAGIRYWEVGNEPDIGEAGGCPYRFTPASYIRYYQHTVTAILRADPNARVGGPALANWQSPILPALLEFCSTNHTPLDFVSWHIYNSDPEVFRDSIDKVHALLKKFPNLKPETFIDEWNMSLSHPPSNPSLQPCFVPEVIWQMKEAGLDYSCYYHIRDWYVIPSQFKPFMSPSGTAFMARWWDRMPQFDGLFDFQNHVRPTYFAFKLISRLQGERLGLTSSNPHVHGFATYDPQLLMYNLLLWNFSDSPVDLDLTLQALPHKLFSRHIVLDASTANDDENARLRPEQYRELKPGDHTLHVHLEPYAVHYWSFE